ncbi:Mandelate racemase/muconate lactonizing protein [Gloeothece citriformis PCC 7424]|uniref:o-succinylbenzoate synthase n=1 Tax=Gloeothece citriformis (strain PCC 7424) TaxID=65393 RepID=B7KIG8_GLOC7|nr:o-succinylbenzoate synthase [Gloeothece citriformis]ACK69374.1 Mandelate racemase/muconate lactonizing protein [Gloeothece citriformis PCC 7424]
MIYSFNYHPYKRHFRKPLNTSHGLWRIREGIIISLKDDRGKIGWGEIAPIPWFGSETLEQGLNLCHKLGEKVTKEDIDQISDRLPACQFGFESALESLLSWEQNSRSFFNERKMKYSYLLPAGKEVLAAWEKISQQYPLPITLKWKIGVYPLDVEIEIFRQLSQVLPSEVKLRLDANGGLKLSQIQHWLDITDKMGNVEFIEQPLPPQELEIMLGLNQNYMTPLALDESVATLKQLEDAYHRGWKGIYVIKAAIAGSPRRLRQFILQNPIDAVFSSVLETKIGRESAIKLAKELSNPERALGFGVNHWFIEEKEE